MFTSLDLLVILFLGIAATALTSLCLMFMLKNKTAQKVFLYIALGVALVTAYFGFMMSSGLFPTQTSIAVMVALASVGALVLDIISKRNEKLFLIARVTAAAALVIGILNAFIL